MHPQGDRYSKEHGWVRVDGAIATVGITSHAQQELGDIVYVQVPHVGTHVEQGKRCAVIESVKTASELLAPVSGEVVEANEALATAPELLNTDPQGAGWIARIRLTSPDELEQLLSAAEYEAFVKQAE